MKFKVFIIALVTAGFTSSVIPVPAESALRVCADPDYLPYSNRAGEGFENKIAETVAKALGETLQYTWASYRGHGGFSEFLSTTLDAGKCDVVIDIPYGSREELTTRPYYVSSYVFIFKKSKDYNLTSMDSPILQKAKVGFERDTPAESGLKIRGLLQGAVPFGVGDESGESPTIMLDAVETEKVDVIITWEPAVGAFLPRYPDLKVVPVPNERATGSPEQYAFPMSMGVREDDQASKKRLDQVIIEHQTELTDILRQHGIELYTPQISPNGA